MAILHPRSIHAPPRFAANAATMLEQVNALRTLLGRIHEGGGSAARPGTARAASCWCAERINRLLDPGSPFLELSALAAHEVYGEGSPPPASSPGSAGSKGGMHDRRQ